MMRFFVVANGVVENVIEADEGFSIPGKSLYPADGVDGGPGWVWVGGAPVEPEPGPTSPSHLPLSMRQLRLGLLLIGGFPASFIQDAINAIPDATQRGVAQIWYDETSVVQWAHPMTQQLIAAAGLTQEQAAAMWMQAKDLEA